tara:strand:+ start:52 stop:1272 length:1221 start_codon:yes stop_codon:yes gene_type:complete
MSATALMTLVNTTKFVYPFVWKNQKIEVLINPYLNYYELDKELEAFRTMVENVHEAMKTPQVKKAVIKVMSIMNPKKPSERNRVWKIRLGDYIIAEDLQRILDCKHIAKIIENYSDSCMSILVGVKHSHLGFVSSDAQHTAVVAAIMIKCGLWVDENGERYENWEDYEIEMWGAEASTFADARQQFQVSNGLGKKAQSKYMQLKNAVKTVRVDKVTDNLEYVDLTKRLSICESFGCLPLSDKFRNKKFSNCFSHIDGFWNTKSHKAVELACQYQSKYFYNDEFHSSVWSVWRDIESHFSNANLVVSDKLMEELAALVQDVFTTQYAFMQAIDEAYLKWNQACEIEAKTHSEKSLAIALIQMYKFCGGAEQVPKSMLSGFVHTDIFDDSIKYRLIDYIDEAKPYYVR